MRLLTWFCVVCLAFTLAVGATAATTEAAKPAEVKVTVNVNKTKVTEVLQSIAQQGKETVIVESVVKGDVTVSLKDLSFEVALNTVCKACKLDWRKVYINKDDKTVEQPDRFAATVRLLTAITYPDMVVSGSSTGKIGMFAKDQKAVDKFDDKMANDLGLTRVYLVTDDAKVAAKLAEKKADESINDFLKKSMEQMESFAKMTPEQQEQAIVEGLNAADQYPADYTAMAMRAMMSIDPELIRQKMARQSQAAFEAMFSMPQEQRRAFFKMQMEVGASSAMTPEQKQMLMDDVKAIQAEKGEGN